MLPVSESLVGIEENEKPVAPRRRNPSPFDLTLVFGFTQVILLCTGAVSALYALVYIEESRRSAFNLGDEQIIPYAVLSAVALFLVTLDIDAWYRRLSDVLADTKKHKEELNVPHGAEPIEVGSVHLSIAATCASGALAGVSLPMSSVILATDNAMHRTLWASWLMSLSAIGALVSGVMRACAPYITSGKLVIPEIGAPVSSLVKLVPLLGMMLCDATAAGLAAAAAIRPLDFVTVSSMTALPSPLPRPHNATSVDWLKDALLATYPVKESANIESDAMFATALLASWTVAAWVAVYVQPPTGIARYTVASAMQAMLAGNVFPGTGVLSPQFMRQYAREIVERSPGVRVTWGTDPLCGAISSTILLACLMHAASWYTRECRSTLT